MGEVYLARDLQLKRSVALKILPPDFADDPERLARFQREAESLAAINHPNIVTVFSIEQVGDLHILTMERVEGRGLDELLPEHGMPVSQLLRIGIALSSALAAAHEKGITHRDLKPANLMLTEDGRLKVLDFGLAKLQPETVSRTTASDSEPMVTREEAIIGTAPYMSPEQIENRPVDGRSDLFSFGIVLYELATGQRPFQGRSMPAVMSAILQQEPRPIHELRRDLPRGLERIISRCLRKDLAQRYQSAAEVRTDLESLRGSPGFRASWHPAHWPAAVRWLVAAMLVLAVGLVSWQAFFQHASADSDRIGIVVLPLTNQGSTDDEYWARGLTNAIDVRLGAVAGLRVVPSHSTLKYANKTPAQIGEMHGVDYVVSGTVLCFNKGKERWVQIAPWLKRASDGTTIWFHEYERILDDIFEVQRDIANQISKSLGLTLTAAERESIAAQPTGSTEAYTLYLQGEYFRGKRTEGNIRKALECYQQAADIDARYALAYAGIAGVWTFRAWYCQVAPKEAYPRVEEQVQKALAADDQLPEAHAYLGLVRTKFDNDFKAGEDAFLKSISLAKKRSRINPSAHHWYSGLLTAQGRHPEALKQSLEAQRLNPVSPIIATWVGLKHYFAGDYDKALEALNHALNLDPDFAPARWHRSWVYGQVGRPKEAITDARKAFQGSGGNPLYTIAEAWALALNGQRAEARRLLNDLVDLQKTRYISNYHLATVYVALGDNDEAFRRLHLANQDQAAWRHYLKVDPRMAPLRNDPRLVPLIEKLGF